jgi:hypothetical protein
MSQYVVLWIGCFDFATSNKTLLNAFKFGMIFNLAFHSLALERLSQRVQTQDPSPASRHIIDWISASSAASLSSPPPVIRPAVKVIKNLI